MDESFAKQYHELEENHWWFRGRRKILQSLLEPIGWEPQMRVLEIGIGSGANLYSLYPEQIDLYGIEPFEENLKLAQNRGPVPVVLGTAEQLPSELDGLRFDVIAMFDVLEHIEDDRSALESLRGRLVPGGKLALTVPAFQWMWGQQDEVSHHHRRYTLSGLKQKLDECGFEISDSTYFNTLLFPPIALWRILNRLRPAGEGASETDFKYSIGFLDRLLFRVFSLESSILKKIRFPFGVSIFVLAQRPG